MIEIEILTMDTQVHAAFYYVMDDPLPAAEDQTRDPAGNALSPEEIQDLRDGTVYEYLFTMPGSGDNVTQIQSKLQAQWLGNRQRANKEYAEKYIGAGMYYDGSWNAHS
jgi:hypothetical protein